MRVISIPMSLRAAAATFLLCIPIAAAQSMIATQAPWWRLPWNMIGIWVAAVAVAVLPTLLWTIRGKRWGFAIVAGFSVLWVLFSIAWAVRFKNAALGYYTVFLVIFFGLALSWLHREISRSFFDPRMHWYEGLPQAIPGVKCEILSGERKAELKVGRIDTEGVFVFTEAPPGESTEWFSGKPELVLHFRDRQVKCAGVPRVLLTRGMGAGIEFQGLSADSKKELGDFVESLRGEGYVA